MTFYRRGAVNGKLIGALLFCLVAAGIFWGIKISQREEVGLAMSEMTMWCTTCGEVKVPIEGMDRKGTQVRCPKCNEYNASVRKPASADGPVSP